MKFKYKQSEVLKEVYTTHEIGRKEFKKNERVWADINVAVFLTELGTQLTKSSEAWHACRAQMKELKVQRGQQGMSQTFHPMAGAMLQAKCGQPGGM